MAIASVRKRIEQSQWTSTPISGILDIDFDIVVDKSTEPYYEVHETHVAPKITQQLDVMELKDSVQKALEETNRTEVVKIDFYLVSDIETGSSSSLRFITHTKCMGFVISKFMDRVRDKFNETWRKNVHKYHVGRGGPGHSIKSIEMIYLVSRPIWQHHGNGNGDDQQQHPHTISTETLNL